MESESKEKGNNYSDGYRGSLTNLRYCANENNIEAQEKTITGKETSSV